MASFSFAHYNWQASLTVALAVVAIIQIAKYFLFKVPALARMREINNTEDEKRLTQEKYPALIRQGKIAGITSMAVFFVAILPFSATFDSPSFARILLEIVAILMVYDFFYYMAHRFLMHGNGPLRRIHGIHHQARDPSWIDSHYVHPIEIAVGLWLFFGTVAGYALIVGPAHVISLVMCFVAFHEINQLNHTYFKLPYFPFKTVSWIVSKHHIHHQNMRKGNYATITLFYDYLFGTLD
jgi:sterol desaturase/sphingolipid hydroxylase (fatty acid hydroxylase superfamily)